MKKTLVIGIGLLSLALMGSMCDTSGGGGGGGGGLFSVSGMSKSTNTWDLFLGLDTTATLDPACPKSFAERGGSPLGLLPGGFYEGAVVVDTGGGQYSGYIPENTILGYQVIAPGAVNVGDVVALHFRYQAAADGLGGDYFRARIIDGNVYREPATVYFGAVTSNVPLESNSIYTSTSNNFGLQFIAGLHGPTDTFYLDDVVVTVNGATLFEDKFEGGDYTAIAPVSPSVLRVPFLPSQMTGLIAPQNNVVLEGANSLAITGGNYFVLYGQGGSTSAGTFVSLTYTDPDGYNPFFGQSQAALQYGDYVGDYRGWQDPTTQIPKPFPGSDQYCAEKGQTLIGPNLLGSANLAGNWTLTLTDVTCQEGGTINETISDIPVARMLNLFLADPADPFSFGASETPVMMFGLSMGYLGLMELTPAILAPTISATSFTGAQLMGVYYATPPDGFPFPVPPGMRVFTGTVMGNLPTANGVCNVTGGSFIALIDDTVFVPPSLTLP